MSIATMILGESGTGKSTSLRNMNPDDTFLIQVVRKPLPFRTGKWAYLSKSGGNICVTDKWSKAIAYMEKTTRKAIVLDDFQYLLANEFMRRSDEKGFEKFTEIGRHAWEVLNACSRLPDDVRVYILAHTQTDDFGHTKAKTIGKLLDEKITVEGLFSIVLRTHAQGGQYHFSTRNSGSDTVKSPMGLFDADLIDNDLNAVDSAICDYYGIDKQPTLRAA